MAKKSPPKRLPNMRCDPDLLAAELSNVDPDAPRMQRFDIPDYCYSAQRFDDRPCKAELEAFEQLMQFLDVIGQGLG